MERFSIRNGMIPTPRSVLADSFFIQYQSVPRNRKGPCGPHPVSKQYACSAAATPGWILRICFTADAPCGILRRKDSSARYNKRTSFSFSYEKDCALRTMTSTPVIYSATAVVSSCWFNSISSVCTRSKNFCLRSSLSCR